MSAIFKVAGWLSKIRSDDPNTLSTLNDLSDILRQALGG